MKNCVLSIIVTNHFGVLTKVTGLFGRRGYNIKALSVGETENPKTSRITILTEGDEALLSQICNQVTKLEDVIVASIMQGDSIIERELLLIKVCPHLENIGSIMQIITDFSAKAYAGEENTVIIEASASMKTIDDLISKLKPFNIVELSRTGLSALEKGSKTLL